MARGTEPQAENYPTKQYAEIQESYLTERFFKIKQGDAYSELKEIKAGAQQGSVLGLVLYLL